MESDILAAVDGAKRRLPSFPLDVRWYPTVSSTMDVAARAIDAGASQGLVIVAEEQTAGRGRRGRTWSSPPGAGLYLSFVFKPDADDNSADALSLLTLAAGVAVREAIASASGFAAELKWPNDVMVGRRKLAGILAEGVGIGSANQTVILGLGVNVLTAAHPGEIAQRATSLEQELGRSVDRALLLEELLVTLPASYERLGRREAGDILREWRAASPSASGALVEWIMGDRVQRGTTAGVDEAGALLVRTGDGVHRVISGELRWL